MLHLFLEKALYPAASTSLFVETALYPVASESIFLEPTRSRATSKHSSISRDNPCHGFETRTDIVLRRMSGVWVFNGSGAQEYKRKTHRYILAQAIEALRSALVVFLYSRAPKSGGYNEVERKSWQGILGAILCLSSGEVDTLASNGNAPCSCWVAGGGALCWSSRMEVEDWNQIGFPPSRGLTLPIYMSRKVG